jgi:hypothetical protein
MRPPVDGRPARRLFKAAAILAFTCAGLAAAEAMTRVVDGYPLMPLRLEVIPGRTRSWQGAAPDASRKWRGDTDALSYVRSLPAAEGVDRGWFTLRPPDRTPAPPDAELAARAKKYPGAELQANYEWNRAAVVSGVCRGAYRNLVDFDRFSYLYIFTAADGSEYPTFRFLPNASYPSGLHTNRFGWRSPAIEIEKPPRTIRIAFVGASTTVSPHAEPYSYPELTAFWLNHWAAARGLGISIDVINAGREGLTSPSFQAIVRQELAPMEPDLVVYYEGSNQFWPSDFLTAPVPRRSRTLGVARRGLERYSALGNRLLFMLRKTSESGAEPSKPELHVRWPSDLDEQNPDLRDPRLPIALPAILRDLETIRRTLEDDGGRLAMTSFVWLVDPGMVVDPARDADLLSYLNTTFWPFSYAHMRRFIDFQTRTFRKYAAVHHLDFIDMASIYPRDPRLFDDAIHMTHAGIRLQAWLTFNALVPIVEREIRSHDWPRPSRFHLAGHPAFAAGRTLMPRSEMIAACGSVH